MYGALDLYYDGVDFKNYLKKQAGAFIIGTIPFTVRDITSQITVTSAVTGGNIIVHRYGKLVQIILTGITTDPATGVNIVIATGIPYPAYYATAPLECFGEIVGSIYTGNTILNMHHTVDQPAYGSMIYFTNDF